MQNTQDFFTMQLCILSGMTYLGLVLNLLNGANVYVKFIKFMMKKVISKKAYNSGKTQNFWSKLHKRVP